MKNSLLKRHSGNGSGGRKLVFLPKGDYPVLHNCRSVMKDKIHPPYQKVLFVDSSTGTKFLIGSTLQPKEKEKFEGKEYPVVRIPVSSASHPFFTKATTLIDSEGRVDKFTKKYQRKRNEEKEIQEKQEVAKKAKIKAKKK
jgi:large subunit ribosomal protein L31